jgi:hypothetical protein
VKDFFNEGLILKIVRKVEVIRSTNSGADGKIRWDLLVQTW